MATSSQSEHIRHCSELNKNCTSAPKVSTAAKRMLVLSGVQGFGLKRFYKVYRHLGSIDAIWSASESALRSTGLEPALCAEIVSRTSKNTSLDSKLKDWLANDDCHLLCLEDLEYPERLSHIYCPPPMLYVQGSLDAFLSPSLAVVGSRKATIHGAKHAREFSAFLSAAGLCIVSGLALGIDAAAHAGALDSEGKTIAVLGTGLDAIYPKKHIPLAQNILANGGLLMSEMPLGTKPLPANFPRRNRLVSGISSGVLVVEASLKSGSLITANYALEQNRDVFAIPGSIDHPLAQGSNALIKQGAKLVDSPEDVLEEFSVLTSVSTSPGSEPNLPDLSSLPLDAKNAYEFVGQAVISFDELVAHARLDPPSMMQALMTLELEGLIASVPGGYQRLK